jgi:hypothetical protein
MAFPNLARFALILAVFFPVGCAQSTTPRAEARLPVMRWDFRPEARSWTEATLLAIRAHGAPLTQSEPADIDTFCPAYRAASEADRQAFWAGLFSALAKHESTWQPEASGGGGLWLGLLQIDPRTARGYGCAAQNRAELFDGAKNLSCGVRIAAAQVARDNEIVGAPGRWRGVARDWAPFRSSDKVNDMAAWTRAQSYCRG